MALAGTYEAPLDVRTSSEVKFISGPKAEAAGNEVRISFQLSAATDVEVAIVDARGTVIRHLAAGLLGQNPPGPFKRNSLAQEISWDRKDDAGQLATGAPFKVQVSAGLIPRLDKVAGWNGNTLGNIAAITVGKQGELFVLLSETFRGGTEMRVLDKDGNYLRTIIPYPANTPRKRLATVGQLEIAGERLPIVFNGLGRTTYPLINGMRQQNMAWNPKGYLVLISALGTMAEHHPPRYLLALHPEGGAPEGISFVGPQLRKGGRGSLGGAGEGTIGLLDHLAVSPDGEWAYVSAGANSRFETKHHGVWRLKWGDQEAGALFLGHNEPGTDDEHFNSPEGLATDAQGNLFVCDWGNNRVMVFSPGGKLLDKFPVDKPQQIAVHPASGVIYTLSCNAKTRWGRVWGDDTVLRKFSAWSAGQENPRELARLEQTNITLMALDGASTPPKLWLAGKGLQAAFDQGSSFKLGPAVDNTNGLNSPMFVAGDAARNRVLLYEMGRGVIQLDLASGLKSTFCKGTDVALDREGNVYVMDGYRKNSISRYAPSGEGLAFSGISSNRIMTKGYRGYGPDLGLPGLAVGANGDIYVLRTSNYGGPDSYGGRVDVFGPDGKPKKESLLEGMGYGDCGLGVDAAGNIYVGSNLKPAGKSFPPAFIGKVPDTSWVWWKGPEREIPWRYTYYNPYLWHWGAVFKFGPAGGVFYGQHPWLLKDSKYGPPKPSDSLSNAPPGAVSYRSACLGYEVKAVGALWRYAGCGIIPSSGDALEPDPGCVCYNSHLAVDDYGRVFAPNVFRFSVEMLDSNGNQLARIGRYGNADSAGPGSQVPEPEIAFAWPAFISLSGGKVYVSDPSNRRVTVVRFQPTALSECAVP